MKKFILLFTLFSALSVFGQVYTSVQNGNFFDFTTWDCSCIPQDGDSLVINHQISMNYGIAYTMGQIYISSQGALTDNGIDKDIYINGGTFINDGYLEMDGFLLDSGYFETNGSCNIDSLYTRDDALNTGDITVYDFAHDEFSGFTNNGTIEITNNFNNQGTFYSNGLITVQNDFSNCNVQNSDASFTCDGIFCVQNNFSNCGTDTLQGTGTIYIGGASTNLGEVKGNLTINTPSGSFSVNSGNVDSSVSFGTASCGLSVEEESIDEDWIIYPNPATNIIKSSVNQINYVVYDINGRTVISGLSVNGEIHIDKLEKGSYMIHMKNAGGNSKVEHFIKL